MKILCVFSTYWPAFQFGGPIFSVHCLNKTLVRKGIDVTVYTTNAGLVGKVPLNQEVNLDGVKVHYFGFTKLFEFMGTIGWQFSKGIAKALKDNLKDFDLIYIVNIWSYPAAIAARYSRLYRKPYILVPSGMLYPNTLSKKIWKKWPYYHFIVKRDLKYASAIHYTAEYEAERTHLFLGLENRAIVVPNGIELSEFCDSPSRDKLIAHYPYLEDKEIILFLGRMHWIKGLDILIKAYAKILKEREDIHLLMVGNDEGGYTKKVKKWLKRLRINYMDYGLGDRGYAEKAKVTFTGMLTGTDKIAAYSGSDIFVLPSYSENFGMSAVEAMACGLPVIISNKVGIYKEIERHKAGIIIDTNSKSLYQGIKLLLEDPELRKEIAMNGRRLAKEYYNIDKVADKMTEAYREILDFPMVNKVSL